MKKVDLKGAKRIESPLAKYNASGQLFCVLCNQPVKNEMVWTAHVNGRGHRDKLQQLKGTKRPQEPAESGGPPPSKKIAIESSPDRVNDVHFKTPLPVTPTTAQFKVPVTSKPIQTVTKINSTVTLSQSTRLLPNTTDTQKPDTSQDDMEVEVSEQPNAKTASSSSANGTSLPEGFFDDPKLDAKARGLEYRDPDEIEWDNFVKEIASEEVKSSTMRVEDEEESTITRELDEIEEQMTHWQRVLDLEKKANELKGKKSGSKQMEEDSGDEDEDYEEDLDWRSKRH